MMLGRQPARCKLQGTGGWLLARARAAGVQRAPQRPAAACAPEKALATAVWPPVWLALVMALAAREGGDGDARGWGVGAGVGWKHLGVLGGCERECEGQPWTLSQALSALGLRGAPFCWLNGFRPKHKP